MANIAPLDALAAKDTGLSLTAVDDKLGTLVFRLGGAKAAHSSAVELRSSRANAAARQYPISPAQLTLS